jgi:hypothetical protein
MIAGAGTAAMASDAFENADGNNDLQVSMSEAMGTFTFLTPHLFGQADSDGDGWLDEGEFYLLNALGSN